ncbi:MAG: alpha/beta fold hydrolase [Polyangiaceae bacterium]
MEIEMSDGVRIHAETRGDSKNPAVILLHGFPQFSRAWVHEAERLASEGFYAVAPDMRGYGKSDKPKDVGSYKGERLALDVKEIVSALGKDRVKLVAHDWGGVVAWMAAAKYPELFEKHVSVNGPHPDQIKRALKSSQKQRNKSWYIFFFQVPFLPETFLKTKVAMKMVFGSAKAGAFSQEDLDAYLEQARTPGAAHAMINYYRASARYRAERLPNVKVPTLVLWGDNDVALGPDVIRDLDKRVDRLEIEHFPQASHWVIEDEPDLAHEAIVRFLKPS